MAIMCHKERILHNKVLFFIKDKTIIGIIFKKIVKFKKRCDIISA